MTEMHYHFDLHGHDARTTERLWTKRLLSVKDKEGGHNAQGRILGRDGEVVWLFLHNQPVALAARDGSVLADGPALEQRNPALPRRAPERARLLRL